MNKQELSALLQQFIGKEYRTYDWAWDILRAVREELKAKGSTIRVDYVSGLPYLNMKQDKQDMWLTYGAYNLVYIKAKKMRGAYKSGWYGHYYDWTIKGFDVEFIEWNNVTDDTLESRVTAVEAYIADRADQKKAREAEVAKLVKKMMEVTEIKEWYGFSNLCKEIYDKRYNSDFREQYGFENK